MERREKRAISWEGEKIGLTIAEGEVFFSKEERERES
jgi:hypothetical protein